MSSRSTMSGVLGMDRDDLIVAGLSFGVPLALALIFVVVVVVLRRASRRPPLVGADGIVRLSGQLLPAATLLSFSRESLGAVEVTFHELIWRPITGPEWRVPIPALLIHPPRFFAGATIEFQAPGSGVLQLVVSDRQISPLSGDMAKRREAKYTNELRYVLLSRGAMQAAPR